MSPKLKEALQKGEPAKQDNAKKPFELTDEEIDLVGGGDAAPAGNCCLGIRGKDL